MIRVVHSIEIGLGGSIGDLVKKQGPGVGLAHFDGNHPATRLEAPVKQRLGHLQPVGKGVRGADISQTVKTRIKKYYGRSSTVIYPPEDTEKFSKITDYKLPITDYFLIVSRLVAYKKIDLAIQAFNRLKLPLVIVGKGRDKSRLRRLAGPTIKFTGWVSEAELIGYYQHCQALIMPQEEDFGIAAVEVQAAGRPVIAFDQGGARETVVDNQTGIFFSQARVDSLITAVKQFTVRHWEPKLMIEQAKKFDQSVFLVKFKKFAEEQWQKY